MGRKKAWIDKANAKSFYLVHRSVADDLNGESDGDEEGTGVKLAPAAPSLNKEGGRDAGDNGSVASSSASGMMGRNLVTPMGFKNDGYDYDQHLRPMGGGVFVGRDGKTSNLGFNSDDNGEEDMLMKEMVAADATGMSSYTTTLPDDVMDEDLRAALFDDADEEGEWEELDDDFVQQVIVEPEGTEPFDYDAHIAKLLARSENMETNQKPRGWDEDDESGEELEDPREVLEDPREVQAYRDMLPEEQRFLEEQFDKTMEGYEDDDLLGYMDGADEDDVDGVIDPEDPQNIALLQAMQEMQSMSKSKLHKGGFGKGGVGLDYDEEWGAGPYGAVVKGNVLGGILMNVPSGAREIPSALTDAADDAAMVLKDLKLVPETGEEDGDASATQVQVAGLIQAVYAEEAYGQVPDHKEIETCQEYLREQEEREQPEWDCETILSTYSTLDNHPSVIGAPTGGKTRQKQRGTRAHVSDDASTASGVSGRSKKAPQRIVLTSKLGIPRGFGASVGAKKDLDTIGETRGVYDEEVEEDEEEDEDEREWEERAPKGRQKETPEEKRLRKAAVKEDRRTKRASKKDLKLAFSTESNAILAATSRGQDINNISTYKY
jgi:protein LTV1